VFTLQANQIQSALRSAYGNTATAQDMVQALCNCAQTVEHRGPMDFSFVNPGTGGLPLGTPPPAGLVDFPGISDRPPPGLTLQVIEFPPWVPIEWDPIPFIDMPDPLPNPPFVFPDGPGTVPPLPPGNWTGIPDFFRPQPTVNIGGPVFSGPIYSGPIQTNNLTTNNIYNQGDTFVGGDTIHEGDVIHNGDTTFEGDTINRNQVTNEGPVTNLQQHFNQGPVVNLAEHHHHGPNIFHGGIVIIDRGQALQPNFKTVVTDARLEINGCDIELVYDTENVLVLGGAGGIQRRSSITAGRESEVVTDVDYDNATKAFTKDTRTITFFGCVPEATAEATVFTATGAKFDSDNCEITEDTASPPEYMPISSS